MNDALLNIGLGIDYSDRFTKPGEVVYTVDEDVFNPECFKSLRIPSQNIARLMLTDPHA